MKNKKYLLIILTAVIIGVGFLVWWSNRVTHLDPPLLKASSSAVGKDFLLTGIAYPNAKAAVFVNDQFVEDIPVLSNGSFQGGIIFTKEGANKVTAKQIYKNITSEFSEGINLDVDLTPPNKNSLKITTKIPIFSKEKSLSITGTANPEDKVLINGIPHTVNTDGTFSGEVQLSNGNNTLNISLSDSVGNTTPVETSNISVDNIPPTVKSFCWQSDNISAGEELVCIGIGSWQGYLESYNSVPITGSIKGNVKSITVDGKRIYWDDNNEIYQRINIYIHGGLNKYKVVVEDKAGNITTSYVDTNAERTRDSLDINLNE